MIIDFYGRNSGGGGGGGVTPAQVRTIVNAELDKYTDNIENGDPVVGMAAQLQSIDGFESTGAFQKRTTGGDASLTSGEAKLLSVLADAQYGNPEHASATASTQSGPRLSVSFTGSNEDLLTELDGAYSANQITFTYDGLTEEFTTDLELETDWLQYFVINGTPLDGESFTYTIDEIEGGSLTASTSYNLVTRNISVTVDADAFEEEAYVEGTTAYTYTATLAIEPESQYDAEFDNLPESVTFNGTPIVGDVITVLLTPKQVIPIVSELPATFTSTSMNCFDKDMAHTGNVYTVTDMVPNLENGYVVYSNASAITSLTLNGSAVTVQGGTFAVVYPTSNEDVLSIETSKPESICVHPRWSGIKDEVYGEYWESEILIPQVDNWYSIGTTRNEIDFVNGQYIERVSAHTATQAEIDELRADTGKTYGVDYIYDNEIIVLKLDTPVITDISNEITTNVYDVDDFGTEEFDEYAGGKFEYKTNLVDKLRVDVLTRSNIVRLTQSQYDNLQTKDPNTQYIITDANAVDMDDYKDIVDCTEDGLPEEGVEGKLYLYNGRYLKWVDGAGNWGTWIEGMKYDNNPTYQIASLKYGVIPSSLDGQVLFTYRRARTSGSYPYFYAVYNATAQTITMKQDDAQTGTTKVVVNFGDINKKCETDAASQYLSVSWIDGLITIVNYSSNVAGNNYPQFWDVISTSIQVGHYESADDSTLVSRSFVSASQGQPIWNEEGVVVGKVRDIFSVNFRLNPTSQYNNPNNVLSQTNSTIGPFFAPTVGGTSGQILKSNGEYAVPTWVSLASLMGGLTIWCGSQDDYDAIATHDANTLYIIRD